MNFASRTNFLDHDMVENIFLRFEAVVNWNAALKESVEMGKVLKVFTVKLFAKANIINILKNTKSVF